jgi:hypothetical protein
LIRQKKEFMNLKAAILKLSNQRSKKEKWVDKWRKSKSLF